MPITLANSAKCLDSKAGEGLCDSFRFVAYAYYATGEGDRLLS